MRKVKERLEVTCRRLRPCCVATRGSNPRADGPSSGARTGDAFPAALQTGSRIVTSLMPVYAGSIGVRPRKESVCFDVRAWLE